jgi:hypothetical protein
MGFLPSGEFNQEYRCAGFLSQVQLVLARPLENCLSSVSSEE